MAASRDAPAAGSERPLVPGWQHAIALTGGVALWMLHLVAAMGTVGISCARGSVWIIHVLTLVTALGTLVCGLLGLHIARVAGDTEHARATAFLGWLAVAFNAISLVLIVFEWIPALVLDACRP